jgi:hypothetical protein
MKMASVRHVAQIAAESGFKAPGKSAIVLKLVPAEAPFQPFVIEDIEEVIWQARVARRAYLRALIFGAVAAFRSWLARTELLRFESHLNQSQSMTELESRMRQLGAGRRL